MFLLIDARHNLIERHDAAGQVPLSPMFPHVRVDLMPPEPLGFPAIYNAVDAV